MVTEADASSFISCYQESENVTNQTGIDVCLPTYQTNLNYSGNYSYSGTPSDLVAWMDGNWSTGDTIDTSKQLFFNYSKPENAVGGYLRSKVGEAGTIDNSSLDLCFNAYSDHISFLGSGLSNYGIFCHNGTSWIKLVEWSGIGYPTLWEEAMIWNISFVPNLLTPVNNSYDYFTYPDITHDIYFSWTDIPATYKNIKISKDPNFNLLVEDSITSSNYTIKSLAPSIYYWKVREYDISSGDYSNYSNVFNFILTRNMSASGITGIEGFAYELSDGSPISLSEATLYIRNEALNWSSTMVTGVNGYYLFDNLTNNTVYSIYAKKTGYEDSIIEYITTIPGQRIEKNILLNRCISGFNCFYNQQYVKFKVQTLFGTKYPGVAISVYKGTELTASDTGTTGTDGSATFLLIKDQQYRITFVSAAFGINREITIIPINTEYIIIITALDTDWEEYNTSIKDTIFMDVSKTIIDDDDANIKVSYLDLFGETTAVTVYLNQTNVSDPHNQTVIDSWTTTGNGTHNFSISPYSGQQYLIHFKAAHSIYGTLEKTYSIFFEKVAGIPGIPTVSLAWFAIICIVLTAAAFTKSTAELGAILACGEGWIFLMIGFLTPLGNPVAIGTALTLASVVSVLAYLSMKSKEAGYS